jgi:ElaB/YqjD/DUF883 family membrane-anchored ribosome-binding protein
MSRINEGTGQGQSGNPTDQLRDKASEVGQNIRDIGGQVRDIANDKYGQVRDAANEKYGQIKDQAVGYYNQGRESAQQWEQSIEDYVQEKPLQAIAMAAGVGLLLGLLWKRS